MIDKNVFTKLTHLDFFKNHHIAISGVLAGIICLLALFLSFSVLVVPIIVVLAILMMVNAYCLQILSREREQELQAALDSARSLEKVSEESNKESEEKHEALHERLECLSAILHAVDECVFSFDDNEVIDFANYQCRDIFAVESEQLLIGKPFHQLLSPDDHIEFESYWHQCQTTLEGEFLPGIEISARRCSGESFDAELFIRKVELEYDDLFVVTLKDITDRKKADAHLLHLATHDDLTDLPTIRILDDRIKLAIARASRYKTRVVVFFLDLNDFEPVNEKYGHVVGDTIIRQVAQRLQAMLREEDTIVRYGGDEFVIIAEGIEDLSDIDGIKSKVNSVFQQSFLVADQHIHIGCSMGCAIYPEQAETPDTLIAIADKQMYRNKSRQRNAPGLTIVSN